MKTLSHLSEVVGWEKPSAEHPHTNVAGVAVDEQDRVFLLTRFNPAVLVYDTDGTFVDAWGGEYFTERSHGLTIDRDGNVFCVDSGDHTVRKFTSDGRLLMTLGTRGIPSRTGYHQEKGVETITHGGAPFNRPTNVAVAPNGDLYVSDGYGNARVHHFSGSGAHIRSWGEPGSGPGEFYLPHGIAVDAQGRVLVADRESDRIQVFAPTGEFVEEWHSVHRPTDILVLSDGNLLVSELTWFEGETSYRRGRIEREEAGQISLLDPDGEVLDRITGLNAPHSLAVDSAGSIYVGDVARTFFVFQNKLDRIVAGTPDIIKYAATTQSAAGAGM
ncbi:peptidyl-alpha-hydroxyglycine alpha-amidating lyase family protein [Dactylosporangium sp. CA-233914]|uniref:peptidyl-alpha-hydroxyglycine alpha-amidating lyase family protein n=1 Tax=Dactylosporangium sp. CA-233914 TaxID=3239934 RepID=UPI003D92F6AC